MIRKLCVVLMVAFAAVPAAAFAGTSAPDLHAGASTTCTAMHTKIGPLWFNRSFTSFGACVAALTPLARQNANTAASSCRSERADANFAATHGGNTFAQTYGVGPTHANAFGKCVSAKERTASAAEVSAASSCRAKLGAAAFVACVASTAHTSLTPAPAQPTPEPTQQEPKGSTPVGGCGTPANGGPAQPLVASCVVAKST